MKRLPMLLSGMILVGCACLPITPLQRISRASAPTKVYIDGHLVSQESHECQGEGGTHWSCEEGWACVRDGCEWCGPGETRCTAGND